MTKFPKPIFTTVNEAQQLLEDKVAYLNRMIRQHKNSPNIISWLDTKEIIEKEFLGYAVTREL